jgi:hypothetical protein
MCTRRTGIATDTTLAPHSSPVLCNGRSGRIGNPVEAERPQLLEHYPEKCERFSGTIMLKHEVRARWFEQESSRSAEWTG